MAVPAPPALPATTEGVLAATQKLVDAIENSDWNTYQSLCAPDLTAFEPEAAGVLIEGLPFHKFYFDLGVARKQQAAAAPSDSTTLRRCSIISPSIRIMGGESAMVAYTRLTQRAAAGKVWTTAVEETRVWQRVGAGWQMVHFHRGQTRTISPQ